MYRITTMSIICYCISTIALIPAEQLAPYSFIRATPSDIAPLMQLALNSHDSYQTLKCDNTPTLRHELFTDGLIEMLYHNEKLIGFYASMHPSNSTICTLSHFFIRKEDQKSGFGRILFNRMTTMAATNKNTKIITWVSDSHAQGFYLKMGASITGYHSCILNDKLFLPVFCYVLNSPRCQNVPSS